MSPRAWWSMALLPLVACRAGGAAPAPAADAATDQARLAEEARIVLETHCGACHIGSYPSALPRALAIFDLSRDDWFATIEPQHHAGILARLSTADPDLGRPSAAPDADVARVRRFLDSRR